MKIAEAFVEVRPDTSKFKGETDKAAREAGDSMESELTDAGKRTATSLGEILAAGAFTAFVVKATKSAADLEQAVGGTAAVFKSQSAEIDRFAESAADSVGLSEQAARELTSQLGGALKGYGFTVDEAADKSITLTRLGADLAATFGGSTKDAVMALSSALRGEFDPLERYSIAINQTLIDQKAVSLGLASSTSNVDQHARAQAALALITERSADAQGQFGREADTASGQAERAAAKAANASADLGKSFLPVYTKVSEVVGGVASAFGSLPGPVQTGAVALAGMVALAGPLRSGFDTVRGIATGLSQAFDRAAISAFDFSGSMDRTKIAVAGISTAGAVAGFLALQRVLDNNAESARRWLQESTGAFKGTLEEQKASTEALIRDLEAKMPKARELNPFIAIGSDEDKQKLDQARARLDEINRALADNQNRSDLAARGVDEYGNATAGATGKVAAETDATKRLSDAYDKQRDALSKLADAKNRQYEAITSLGSDASAYEAAQADVTTARQKLAGARTPTEQVAALNELEAAVRRQADARVKVAETQAKVNDTELTAAQRAALYRDELNKLTVGLPALRAQLQPTIVLLDTLAADRTASIKVEVDGADEARRELAVLQAQIEYLQRKSRGESFNIWDMARLVREKERELGVEPRATGGPVEAMRPYTVGEHGKETFVPAVAGEILPAGSGVGGDTYNITTVLNGHDWSLAEAGREFSTRVGELVGGGQR